MAVDKNLFLYDLAVVAIFKNEAPYLKEWLDYHLLAGVEHFYLYNNDSTDDYKEILAPYVEANLVTLTEWPGPSMLYPTYNDAVERFRFFCRYIAFIDLDEFVYPKVDIGEGIIGIVDEVLSHDANAAGLAINFQYFGSNGHETADYSRGVLERFTRRASEDWKQNEYVKTIANPRKLSSFLCPHAMNYFMPFHSVNANGELAPYARNENISTEKIVVNHYYTKSQEEFVSKRRRGFSACVDIKAYPDEKFYEHDRNEIFDDGILKYRAALAENFSLESDDERFNRVEKTLIEILTQRSPFDAPAEFFVDKLETFLTCRKLAEVTGTKIGSRSAEEYALVWIYQTLTQAATMTYAEVRMLLKALPEILSRPFPLAKKILQLTCEVLIPSLCETLKKNRLWAARAELLDLQKFLRLIK